MGELTVKIPLWVHEGTARKIASMQEVYDAAMAMHRLVLAGRINRSLKAGDKEASAALDAMDDAFDRAEEVERG